ncbi:MAG: LysR substrate-binding domain-containing protein [Pseudomonadota bacterium]
MTDPPAPKRTLPPLTALRAAAAVARTGGFASAARALGVTPSAVSHQVRRLEQWLGAPVFERDGQATRPTPMGADLCRAVTDAFENVEAALAAAQARCAPSTLRIAALPLFANAWLIPRLGGFEQAYPKLSLDIDTGAHIADLRAREADVAIRTALPADPTLETRKLLDIRGTPVCAPPLASTLRRPRDLASATVIELSVGAKGWPDWLAAAGAADVTPARVLRFDTLLGALGAAVAGRGVMLAPTPLIWAAPEARALAAPFPDKKIDAGSYVLALRRDAGAASQAFAAWVAAEMRADLPRLRGLDRS